MCEKTPEVFLPLLVRNFENLKVSRTELPKENLSVRIAVEKYLHFLCNFFLNRMYYTDMSMNLLTFNQLYKAYAKDVHRFAFWLCADADEANDITLETFERAWLSDSEIRTETVKAYLFTIARNRFLGGWRRRKRHAPLNNAIPDPDPSPETKTQFHMDLQSTLQAMQQLPELDRTVLILRAEEGLSYEEISRATGLTLGAVKIRVFRARAKLASLISETTKRN
jgi:RNA polymerase sigma-70 factor, ECF subfamily